MGGFLAPLISMASKMIGGMMGGGGGGGMPQPGGGYAQAPPAAGMPVAATPEVGEPIVAPTTPELAATGTIAPGIGPTAGMGQPLTEEELLKQQGYYSETGAFSKPIY